MSDSEFNQTKRSFRTALIFWVVWLVLSILVNQFYSFKHSIYVASLSAIGFGITFVIFYLLKIYRLNKSIKSLED